MDDSLTKIIDEFITLKANEGQNKILPLREAIQRYIKPGMTIHLGTAGLLPTAAIYELTRLFYGQNPNFTLISLGLTTIHSPLIYAGLVRKTITTYLGDAYPSPSPNPVFQKAYQEGHLEIEHWSLLSLVQRLQAGAMGLEFFPTRSLIGSSMAKNNQDDFLLPQGPFSEDKQCGLLRFLNPDISIYHGLAADPQGNTLIAPPYAENIYGGLASKRGVIVTVEKIVTTELIRKYARLARLPGYKVLSVSEVPWGAHPGGCHAYGLEFLESYAIDHPFILELRRAGRSEKDLNNWMKEWILEWAAREDYLQKLGQIRLDNLKAKAQPEFWKKDLASILSAIQFTDPANSLERMVVAAGRKISRLLREKNYKTILAGIGASHLAAWLANYLLRSAGVEVDLMAEIGFFGYLPRPADPYIFNFTNIPTCKMLTDIPEILGLFTGGYNSACLGVLSAAQVDRFGNLNSTIIPPQFLITGSGGANDVASNAAETLVVLPHGPFRLVPQVPYITAPGKKIKTLVTTLGVFEKLGGEEFFLTGIILDGKSAPAEIMAQLKEKTPWEFKIAPSIENFPLPTATELMLLRLFDPQKFFLTEE